MGLIGTGGSPPDSPTEAVILGGFHLEDNWLFARQIYDGIESEESYPKTTNLTTFQKYKLKWSADAVSYIQNGILLGGSILDVPPSALYPALGGRTSAKPYFCF